jgi:uncharacterized protein (UPF0261 family)
MLLLMDARFVAQCVASGGGQMLGFDVVVAVDGIWRTEGCQHEHASCAGTCSDGDVDDDDDGIIIAASH